MSFLRLGVHCAVIDDQDRILLSHREDLKVWDLPGGRLESCELLADAAAREVREETGVIAHIERPLGLYYLAGWRRLNILFAGWPLGGDLRQRTAETRANQYFAAGELPPMPWAILALDALAGTRHKPRVIEMSAAERRQMKLKLRWRWVRNLLAGQPEPGFPRFDVSAVAVVWEESYRRVLTLPDLRGRALPRAICYGESSPWDELAAVVLRACGILPAFRWVGLWQDVGRDQIELIFAATTEETDLLGVAEWSTVRNAGLNDRDAAYLERVKPGYARDAVWTIIHEPDVKPDETIAVRGGRV